VKSWVESCSGYVYTVYWICKWFACSPSYVDAGSDLDSVCNRICWAKFKNAGQTCISVDYIMVQASVDVMLLSH